MKIIIRRVIWNKYTLNLIEEFFVSRRLDVFFNLIIKFGMPDTRTKTINEISACISANNPYAFTPINLGIISPAVNNMATLHPRIINEI